MGQEEYLAKRYPSVLVLLMRAFAPGWLQNPFQKQMSGYELQDLPISGPLQDVPLLSGCCMVVQPRAFRAVGGFDERFFLYLEDADLTRALTAQGRCVHLPVASVRHGWGRGSYRSWRLMLVNLHSAWLYFSKWGWRWW